MREEELVHLVKKVQRRQTEFQNVELKAAAEGFPRRIYDTLSSFSNQDDGGVILFGVSEEDNYDVTGVYNIRDAQEKAMEACEQMEPKVRAVFSNAEIDGKIVFAAEIPPVEYWLRPVFYKGAGRLKGSYILSSYDSVSGTSIAYSLSPPFTTQPSSTSLAVTVMIDF